MSKFVDIVPGLLLVGAMSFLLLLAAGKIPTNFVVAKLTNASVVLDSKRVWVGLIQDSVVSFDVQVQNIGSESLWIYGGSGTCGCKKIADLPIELKPGESKPVSLKFTTTVESPPSLMTGSYWFFVRTKSFDRRIVGSFCGVALSE